MNMDGGADRWQGTAQGLWTWNGVPGLSMGPLSQDFITSFMRRNRVDIYNGDTGNWVTALTLDGTTAGMAALIECLDAHDSAKPNNNAPAKPRGGREFGA